jgi:NDP-sugar pyrophosphorylase family protein
MAHDGSGLILCGDPHPYLSLSGSGNIPLLFPLKEGYTLLDKQIFEFKYAGVDSVAIVAAPASYGPVRDVVGKYEDIDITVVKEEQEAGSLGALRYARELFDTDLVVRNADIVSDINMKKFVSYAKGNSYPMTMFVTHLPSPYGVVRIQGDSITGFEEKPLLDAFINAGIYYVRRDLAFPDTYKEGKLEYTLFPELARDHKMGHYREDVFWRSLKTFRDIEAVHKEYELKTDKAWGYEKLLVHTDKYMTKELFLREGFSTSYHFHEHKDETMFVTSGRGYIKFDDRMEHFAKNDKIHIRPNVAHSIVALENTLLYEFSTPHVNDTSRI